MVCWQSLGITVFKNLLLLRCDFEEVLPNEDHCERVKFAVLEEGLVQGIVLRIGHRRVLHVGPSGHRRPAIAQLLVPEEAVKRLESLRHQRIDGGEKVVRGLDLA